MPKRRYTRGKGSQSSDNESVKAKTKAKPALATSMAWAGTKVKVNTFTVEGTFDPRVPIDQPGEEGDDALIWADVPETLCKRLEKKPQQITVQLPDEQNWAIS